MLSQWFAAAFEVDGVRYPTAEHWMMAAKARVSGDRRAEQKVLVAPTPGEAKRIGRTVAGFDGRRWNKHRVAVVVEGNVAKFGQNPELARYLLDPGDMVLVEASPTDRIWGIGLGRDDHRARRPSAWPGENLLGFALMETRQIFRDADR